MRDKYDIKLLLGKGYFPVFKQVLKDFNKDFITADNYAKFSLSKDEIEEIQQTLKLSKSRVYSFKRVD